MSHLVGLAVKSLYSSRSAEVFTLLNTSSMPHIHTNTHTHTHLHTGFSIVPNVVQN